MTPLNIQQEKFTTLHYITDKSNETFGIFWDDHTQRPEDVCVWSLASVPLSPLEDDEGHEADHHGGQDGAVDGDEFVMQTLVDGLVGVHIGSGSGAVCRGAVWGEVDVGGHGGAERGGGGRRVQPCEGQKFETCRSVMSNV